MKKTIPAPWKKGLVSIWLLFHLLAVLISPNSLSYLNQQFQSVFSPYLNTLAMNRSWQFFSPDPGLPLFLQYEIWKDKKKIDSKVFPPLEPPFFRLPYIRRIYLVRILTVFPDLAGLVFGPYLCKIHPDADELELSFVAMKPPSWNDVNDLGLAMNDLSRRDYTFIRNEICYRTDSP